MSRPTTPMPSGPSGVVIVDKPSGMTSHDVVGWCRRVFGTRKVGHAGTLDPMATGVLVLGVGQCTRLLTYLVGADKTYTATIRLGVSTVTDDSEGEALTRRGTAGLQLERVYSAIEALTGPIEQVPSSVSAIKVGGRRAYDKVRSGEEVTLAPRRVTVHEFDVLDTRQSIADGTAVLDLDVRTEVSSGTYVRALARDLGEALAVGGHLTALRRLAVGPFHSEDAHGLEDLRVDGLLEPAEAARRAFSVLELTEEDARKVVNGGRLSGRGLPPGPLAAISGDRLLAVMEERDGAVRPLVVFPPTHTSDY